MSTRACFLFGLVLLAAAGGQPGATIGRIDTVGGTTCDWLAGGPMPQMVVCEPEYGVHVAWLFSADTSSAQPDRTARYNYYDFTRRAWNWIDPDFLMSGVDIFGERAGFGNVDVDPNTGQLYACATMFGGSPHPVLARDFARGAGIFEYCAGTPVCDGFVWPLVSVGHSGKAHVALTDNASQGLYYSGVAPWSQWSTPFHIPPPVPDPGYPTYLIAASKRRPSVCVFWADVNSLPRQFYYRRSTDDGVTWLPPDTLPLPPAFSPGGDTTVSGIDLYPWYDPDDEEDCIHLVAAVIPVVAETARTNPAEIWYWNESSGWSRVARAGCDPAQMQGALGPNAVYAGRPSLGRCAATGELICAWEQFDSLNVEPRTGLLRADIWAARGDSAGRNWGQPVRLTEPDSTTKRFPSLAGTSAGDTFVVSYITDLCAGFMQNQQGPATRNPFVIQWAPLQSLPAAAVEERRATHDATRVTPGPTIVRNVLRLPYSLTPSLPASLLDAAGRRVLSLKPGANDISRLAPGIYFVRPASGVERDASSVTRVLIAR